NKVKPERTQSPDRHAKAGRPRIRCRYSPLAVRTLAAPRDKRRSAARSGGNRNRREARSSESSRSAQALPRKRDHIPDDQSDVAGGEQRLPADNDIRLEAFGVDLARPPAKRRPRIISLSST